MPKMTNTPEALRKVKSAKESYQRQKIQNKLSFKPLKGGKKGPEWRGMGKKKQIEYQEKEEETERQLKLKMATNRLGNNRNRYEDGSDFERKTAAVKQRWNRRDSRLLEEFDAMTHGFQEGTAEWDVYCFIREFHASEEEMRQLKNCFERVDMDNSGTIDYKEFFDIFAIAPTHYTDAVYEQVAALTH